MKNKCVIYAPVETYSGYGANARDKVKAIIELKKDKWDIKIISCRWGNTPMSFIDETPEWHWLKEYILSGPLNYQPDYMFWITIPPEAQVIGKWNCLITAGIETTICNPTWIDGLNRMDLNIVSSKHAKDVFLNAKFEERNQQNQVVRTISLNKPVEIVFEGVDLNLYKLLDTLPQNNLYNSLNSIPESFAYLYLGHWLQGDLGEDRKNTGLLIKAFYETFKNKKQKPALILKTSILAGSSYMDRNLILDKIEQIKRTVNSKDLPNIYLLHGEFTDEEINGIYNHPKVKAMVNLTKGEGFGRPLLEFTQCKKPIITTAWSGHTDFLDPQMSVMMGGQLTPVHPSAINDWVVKDSQWFSVDQTQVGYYLKDVFENYKNYTDGAKRQAYKAKTEFSWDKMKEKIGQILEGSIPEFSQQVQLKLPQLKKIELPKLKNIK